MTFINAKLLRLMRFFVGFVIPTPSHELSVASCGSLSCLRRQLVPAPLSHGARYQLPHLPYRFSQN